MRRDGPDRAARTRQDEAPPLPIPRGIIARHEHGQNFLTRAAVLDREVSYAGVTAEDTVLEIGPGIGHLTERLAQVAAQVEVIELDEQFRPILDDLQRKHGNVAVTWGDATTLPWPAFSRMVANLPYKPALPLLFRLLEQEFHTAVLVIQERLARRLAAKPGEAGYSRISVLAQQSATLQVMEVVKARDFRPAPEVDSAMLRLRRHRPRYRVSDRDYFRRFLDLAFLRRSVALRQALPDLPGPAVTAALAGIDAAKPVQATPPETLASVAEKLFAAGIMIDEVPDEVKRKAQKLTQPPPERADARPRRRRI